MFTDEIFRAVVYKSINVTSELFSICIFCPTSLPGLADLSSVVRIDFALEEHFLTDGQQYLMLVRGSYKEKFDKSTWILTISA